MVKIMRGIPFYATAKLDGSSGTMFKHDGHFGVCSRNLELKESDSNIFWRCARPYIESLPNGMAVQFEAVGPGIQKNPAGFDKVQPRAFNIFSIDERRYQDADEFLSLCEALAIPAVELLSRDTPFVFYDESLRRYAEGVYPNGRQREGVVIRPMREMQLPLTGDRVSFKALNLLYKEK